MGKPHIDIDWTAEQTRMAEAAELRCAYEARWKRAKRAGHVLEGAWGRIMQDEIEGRFNGGPAAETIVDDDGNKRDAGGYTRWKQLASVADLGGNPLEDVVEQQCLLYRSPLKITGDIASPAWEFLRNASNFDAVMIRKQRIMYACGSVAVRPTLIPYPYQDGAFYPPGLTAVPPDRCFAIPDPANRSRAIVYGECVRPDVWLIWDVSNPNYPRWSQYRRPDDWVAGRRPIVSMEGDAYPWWLGSMPWMPALCQQADAAATELLPVSSGVLQEVKDLLIQRLWAFYTGHAGSFNRMLLAAEAQEVEGLKQLMLDPVAIGSVWGQSVSMLTVENSTEPAMRLWQMNRDRTLEWCRRINPAFTVSSSEVAKSGTALLIELTGKVQAANEAETRSRSIDRDIILSSVLTFNYLVDSAQIGLETVNGEVRWNPDLAGIYQPEYRISEARPTLGYPRAWNEIERQAIRAETERAVADGRESPRALWLLDHGLDDDRPDGPNWLAADEGVRASLGDAMAYASLGYGLRWSERAAMAAGTPQNEATLYTPTPEVADTAAEGLRLRDAFRGRATDGKTPEGRRLIAKAKALRNRTPMLDGEVRALNVWLRAHEGDAGIETDVGAWGDPADPSGLWIDYLTQGGDPGLAWTNATLAPVPAAEEAGDAGAGADAGSGGA